MAVTFYTSRIILNELGTSDYGVYNVVGGVVTLMSFLNGALSAATSRFLTYELGMGNQSRLDKTFSASLNLHIFLALLVLILGETLGLWFFYEYLVIPDDRMNAAFWVYQFSVFTTMANFTQLPYNAALIAHENMSIYAYVGLYEAISRLAIVFLLTISPIDKLIFYALLLMLNSIGIQIFYRAYASKRYSECKFRVVKDKTLYQTLLGYSGWNLFGSLVGVCQGQGINIVLNMFFGPVVNAARAISVQIQGGVSMFVGNFLTAVRPQVVKSFAEGKIDEMYTLTFRSAKFSYFLMLAITLPICFEINFILRFWLGDSMPEYTPDFALIILITYLMETYHQASLMPFHAIGKIKWGTIIGGTIMISALPISYAALKLGAPAHMVFWIIFIVNFTQMFWGWIIVHYYEPFSYKVLIKRVYIPTIIVTLISIIAPYVITDLMSEGWLRLLILTSITEIVLILSVLIVGMTQCERQTIIYAILSKLRQR